jgi:thioredoxin-dependent peroxiredoxin
MSQSFEGKKAPPFSLNNQNSQKRSLKEYSGSWLVLYFYPKDNTPGCTMEGRDFTALKADFEKLGATVVGVSPDTESKHCSFIEKQELSVELLADPDHVALEKYGVWQLKKNYGREYMGVVRSTFLIDPAGVVKKVWSSVKVKGHAAEVLETIQSFK